MLLTLSPPSQFTPDRNSAGDVVTPDVGGVGVDVPVAADDAQLEIGDERVAADPLPLSFAEELIVVLLLPRFIGDFVARFAFFRLVGLRVEADEPVRGGRLQRDLARVVRELDRVVRGRAIRLEGVHRLRLVVAPVAPLRRTTACSRMMRPPRSPPTSYRFTSALPVSTPCALQLVIEVRALETRARSGSRTRRRGSRCRPT